MIRVVDNFFEKDLFEKVKSHVTTKLHFTNRYFDGAEVSRKAHYGLRWLFSNDPEFLKYFIKQAEKKFYIKITETHEDSGVDLRNLDEFKPHQDDIDGNIFNLLIMIAGPTAVTNGTVFYHKDKELELDMHVGFRENRAILFPSNKFHSPHASNIPNLRRFSATIFIGKYENVLPD